MKSNAVNILSKYIPERSVSTVVHYLDYLSIHLRITKPRKTKLGDYRPPTGNKGHRISINNDMNPYAFLLTLVHEIAHAYNFADNGTKVAPHGPEWKAYFIKLMRPFLTTKIYPEELLPHILNHLENLTSSSCYDPKLTRELRCYDKYTQNMVFLSDLPDDAVFTWRNGKKFQKLDKLRKRYRCREINSSRIYLFSPVAEVELHS